MENSCCFFGHREVYENIEGVLYDKICRVISENNIKSFLVGGHGGFDSLSASAVSRAKKEFPDIRLLLIRPYLTKELSDNKAYYNSLYDEIIIPSSLSGVNYKSVITKRNFWMADESQFVIAYIRQSFGGAFKAVSYAQKQNKIIARI